MKRVTVRDIAAHAGVSIATVSRVLNEQSHVAPETRDLVQRTIDALGGRVVSRRPAPGFMVTRCAAARLSACCSRRSMLNSSARIGSSGSRRETAALPVRRRRIESFKKW